MLSWWAGPAYGVGDQLSIVTAYLCVGLLGATLLIGPWRALRSGRPTLNHYVRRDMGIWAALAGLVHLVLATGLSMRPRYIDTFVRVPDNELAADLFTWGSIIGLVVGANFLLLLALSSDAAMRRLGLVWWKRLQRTSYLAFLMTIAHGLAFQLLEARTGLAMSVLLLCAVVIAAARALAGRAVRKCDESRVTAMRGS
jgi:DMSO/TMAO reductase YedYZ heme-binding membrane subunit